MRGFSGTGFSVVGVKLILSRKGFDSSAGGCPSPIFPDGSLLALPIPDPLSPIRYRDLVFNSINVGRLVNQLTKGRIKAAGRAHLDPDLIASLYSRSAQWRPVFGQTGAAQGHLNKQGVAPGDVFLFFGLFRPVELHQRKWRFVPGSQAKHIIWGWLQVEQICPVDQLSSQQRSWLEYHPHLRLGEDLYNTLYLGRERLLLAGRARDLPGAGVFPTLAEAVCLTAGRQNKPSYWVLPRWFYPQNKTPLTYHGRVSRWSLTSEHCYLQAAARGQEFVLNTEEYPQALAWIAELIE